MKRAYMLGFWWDGLDETEARNGYNPATWEEHAQFRIGKLHMWWGAGEAHDIR